MFRKKLLISSINSALACMLLPALTIAPLSAFANTGSELMPYTYPAASQLDLTWKVIDHGIGENIFQGSLTIHNNGVVPLGSSDWKLYYSSVRPPASVLPSDDTNGDTARAQLAAQNVKITNADDAASGDYFVLEPQAGFTPIAPGQSREIKIIAQYWQMLKNDSPSGFHISFAGSAPQAVLVKVDMDAKDARQTTQSVNDIMPVQTASLRHNENTAIEKPLAVQHRIVPQPLSVIETEGAYLMLMSQHVSIHAADNLNSEAQYLQSALNDLLNGNFHINPSVSIPAYSIRLDIDPTLDADNDGAGDTEAYKMTIDANNGITITGSDATGVLYGIQSLRQLIPSEVYAASSTTNKYYYATLPAVEIIDAPRFEYRGMMLDVSRNFQSVETVYKLLDLLAFYKINKFEIILANDEGWRLQIPGIPELTDFGAKRGFDLSETDMLHTFMGAANGFKSGDGIVGKPQNSTDANLGSEPKFQGFEVAQQNFLGKGWGYYTVEDFKNILAYAADRHIDVIIEYDMPAHARAAIKAMEYRYNKYKDTDMVEALKYRLIDPNDTSAYYTPQFYTDNFVNPSLESTFTFLEKVILETKKMYDAVPGAKATRLHGGGDELPHLGPNEWWAKSPAVQLNPTTAGKTDAELFDYFFLRWQKIITDNGFEMATWGDVLSHNGTGNVDYGDIYPIFWNNVWGWGNEHQAYKFANQGYQVVLSHATNLYLDLAYNKHPDEIGYHWAGYTDTKKTFEYRPFNIYANAVTDKLGNPVEPNANWVDLTEAGKANVSGIQAQLFSENQKSPEILDYMVFPKLLGAAERAWTQNMPIEDAPDSEGKTSMDRAWEMFSNTLGQYSLPQLEYYQAVDVHSQLPADSGVNFRIPLPGAVITNGQLQVNVRFPGLAVEYSLDSGSTWLPYHGNPVTVGDPSVVMTRSVSGSGRHSRAEFVQ